MIYWLDAAMFLLAIACAVIFRDLAAKCYFTVLAICQPILAATYHTPRYSTYYYLFTAILLFLALWISIDVMGNSLTKELTLLAAFILSTGVFYAASDAAQSISDIATIVEETLLAGYAVIVGLSSPKQQPMLYVSLALAWLFQSGFGFGYTMHFGSRSWYVANQFFPAFINISIFSWMIFYTLIWRNRGQLTRRTG